MLEVTNVSRIVALGGSIRRILRGSEAPGVPDSNGLSGPRPETGGPETGDRRLEVTNVSRIVGLGGSIRRILRVSEAPGGPDSNVAKGGSGSA